MAYDIPGDEIIMGWKGGKSRDLGDRQYHCLKALMRQEHWVWWWGCWDDNPDLPIPFASEFEHIKQLSSSETAKVFESLAKYSSIRIDDEYVQVQKLSDTPSFSYTHLGRFEWDDESDGMVYVSDNNEDDYALGQDN